MNFKISNTTNNTNINQSINTSNYMFGREIWDKLPECTFENFEIARESESNFKFSKNCEGDFFQKLPEPNTCLLVNPTN